MQENKKYGFPNLARKAKAICKSLKTGQIVNKQTGEVTVLKPEQKAWRSGYIASRKDAAEAYKAKRAKAEDPDVVMASRYANHMGTKFSLSAAEEQKTFHQTLKSMKKDKELKQKLYEQYDFVK